MRGRCAQEVSRSVCSPRACCREGSASSRKAELSAAQMRRRRAEDRVVVYDVHALRGRLVGRQSRGQRGITRPTPKAAWRSVAS